MTDALDKLRKLDDAASPGPWKVDRANIGIKNGDLHLLDKDGSVLARFYVPTFTNAQLAVLSHLLRPAFEALKALDACAKWDDGDTPDAVELNYTQFAEALGSARAVLTQLEEAL